ncbi:MAG: alanine racemase [Acidimicrobiia bacterium]|nr:alanine racemase [Acidimicrobiia bacterium]
MVDPTTIHEIPTPALLVDRAVFDANVAAMAEARPGAELRPHVKAFKSTALAAELAAAGHRTFCAATPREIEGMVGAGVGDDLLLANETLDPTRLGRLVEQGADITVAVDSDITVDAAIAGGIGQVLIDVEVGMPRCGCDAADAGRLAERARAGGLEVRGVMGYEGHLMTVPDPDDRRGQVEASMAQLLAAHADVGGDIVSGGGTGTYAVNTWVTEIQAGSYCLMDTHYGALELPFGQALTVLGTVLSVSAKGWAVADIGLKSLGMDHGDPAWPDGNVFFCSDEHTTLLPGDGGTLPAVGERVQLLPAHVDPTVARHEQLWVVEGEQVVDVWPIDLRHW